MDDKLIQNFNAVIDTLEKACIVNYPALKNIINKEEILELIKKGKINHYHLKHKLIRDIYCDYYFLNKDCMEVIAEFL